MFSSIDQKLAENSVVSLSRVVEQGKEESVKLGGESFWMDPGGISREIEIRGGLKPILKPQVGFLPKNNGFELSICCGNHEDTINLFLAMRNYSEKELWDTIHVKSAAKRSDGFIPTLVLHRKKELYFRPTDDLNDPNSFIRDIKEKFVLQKLDSIVEQVKEPKNCKQQVHETPSVVIKSSFHFDAIYRAISKSMFNILADSQGHDFVLKNEFDEIRDYITGHDVRPTASGPEDVLYDRRFVSMIGADEKLDFLEFLKEEKMHIVLLFNNYPYIFGLINFYGSNAYVVNFGEIKANHEIFEFYVFDSNARSHERKDKFRYISDVLKAKNGK